MLSILLLGLGVLQPTMAFSSGGPVRTGEPGGVRSATELSWDARSVEHLYNRAGFGASPAWVARGVELGPEAIVDELLADAPPVPFRSHSIGSTMEQRRLRDLSEDERREERRRIRRDDREQLVAFLEWWVERILSSDRVLEERMVLFWHGHFPSSQQDVQKSHEMIQQQMLFRQHALGSFRDLVNGIARDPAMLEYLDNDSNRKGKPNENFARELLELFTLGEGNYEEDDIKDVARAFTGWTDRDGAFFFARRQHDNGQKRIFGKRGAFGGEDVLELVLAREQCSRFLAGELLAYFEGVVPDERRVKRYAKLLRKKDYEVRPFLRELFLDPEFYSERVVGARIASPIDLLAGIARRAEVDPPARLVAAGAALLGERLLFPPSVEGWKGGQAWITTGSLLMRANLAGVLVGEVRLRELLERGENDPALDGLGGLAGRALSRLSWTPRGSFARALLALEHEGDADLAHGLASLLLAVEPSPSVLDRVERFLAAERERAGIEPGRLLDRPSLAEPCLRRTAHFVLSLPEAQLH